MFAFPEQVNLWQTIRKSPLLWFGVLLIIVHSATFYSQKQTERGIQNAKNKYREWWINGGQMALASRGIDVSDNSYEAFEQEYLQKYLNKKIRYTLNFVPATDTPFQWLTSGILQPNWISLAFFIWFYVYLATWIGMHWSPWRALGFGVICNVVGAALYAGYRVFTQEHLLQPFSGTDAMLAGFLGAFVAMHMEHPVNMWLYLPKRGWVATQIPALALPVFWFLASVPLYLWGKPPHYLPAFGMNLLVLLAGWQAAKTLDVQWRRHTAPDASTRHAPSQAERSRSGEASLKDAWALMEKYDMDNALKQFKNGIQILLQDPETNRQTIENAFAKLAKESLQLPLQPMESFELAQRLEAAQCYNASIHLLEKLIKMHPPESIRRHALYSIASQRIDHNIEPHLAKPYVEEILKSGDDDIIARRARTFLT